MKKTNTTLAMIILMIALVTASFAGTTADSERMQLKMNDEIIELHYKSEEQNLVKIAIRHESGLLVLQEEISTQDEFLRSYDFSDKAQGFYTFEIVDNKGDLSREIGFFKAETILTMTKPSHNKFKVVYGVKRESKIQVKMYNDKEELVFEDIFVAEKGFIKTYMVADYNTDATRMKVITPLLTKEFELK